MPNIEYFKLELKNVYKQTIEKQTSVLEMNMESYRWIFNKYVDLWMNI